MSTGDEHNLTSVPSMNWSVAGFGYFLGHPNLWLRPIIGTLIGWAIIALLSLTVFYALFPSEWAWLSWSSWWDLMIASGASMAAGLTAWFVILPFILSFAYESLAKRVLRDKDVELGSERLLASLASTAQMMLKTLHWRLLWPILSLLCLFVFPPASVFISAFGLAHVSGIDGVDLALALRGYKGKTRAAMIRQQNGALLSGAVGGMVLGLLLSWTIIGWVLLLPALFTGTALWVARWPGTATPLPADSEC